MVELRAIDAGDWQDMRDVRLAALRDAPYAFESLYEHEVRFTEADWQRRIAAGCNYLAYVPGLGAAPAGIVGGFVAGPGTVELVSLWVRPQARRRGAGQALVWAVLDWAWARRMSRVHLWVTETNDDARLLYDRCGFWPAAERRPLKAHAGLFEIGMVRPPSPRAR